jgi:hypothetical protein
MPIFPILEVETIVQTDDKTRISGLKSFKTDEIEAISLVRIQPETAGDWIEVATADPTDYTKWYLDWVYDSDGDKVVSLEITADGVDAVVKTSTISVIDAADENLFSTDADFNGEDSEVLAYVKPGRSSFLNFHRQAQKQILEDLYKKRIMAKAADSTPTKIEAEDFVDVNEVKQWSKYLALSLIYNDISNATDDVFAVKSAKNENKVKFWKEQSLNNLSFDADGDGTIESEEKHNNYRSGDLTRQG